MSTIQGKIINGARRLFESLKSFINPGEDPIRNAEEEKKVKEEETRAKILSRHGLFGSMYYDLRTKETDYGRKEHPKMQAFSKNMQNRWEAARATLLGPRIIIADKDEKIEDALKTAEEAGTKIDTFVGNDEEVEYINEDSKHMRTAVVRDLDVLTIARLRTAEHEMEIRHAKKTTKDGVSIEKLTARANEEKEFWKAVIEIENGRTDIQSIREKIATYDKPMQEKLRAYYATVHNNKISEDRRLFPTLFYAKRRQAVIDIHNPQTREKMIARGEQWDRENDPEHALLYEKNGIRTFETTNGLFCGNEFRNPKTGEEFAATMTHDVKDDCIYIKTSPESEIDLKDVIKKATGRAVKMPNEHFVRINNATEEVFNKIGEQLQKEIQKAKVMEAEKEEKVHKKPEQNKADRDAEPDSATEPDTENPDDKETPEKPEEPKTELGSSREHRDDPKPPKDAPDEPDAGTATALTEQEATKADIPEDKPKPVKVISSTAGKTNKDAKAPEWVGRLSPDEYDEKTGTGIWNIAGDNAIVIYEPAKNKVDIQILKDDIEIEPIKAAQKLKRENPGSVKRYNRRLDEYGLFETTTVKLRENANPTRIVGNIIEAIRKQVKEFNRKPELAEVFAPRGGVNVYEAKHGGRFTPETWPSQFENEVQSDFDDGAKSVMIHSKETGEVAVYYNTKLVNVGEDTKEDGVLGYIMEEDTGDPNLIGRVIDARNDLSDRLNLAWAPDESNPSHYVIVYDFFEGQDKPENILQMRDSVVNYVSPEIIFEEIRQIEDEQRAHEEYKRLVDYRDEINSPGNLLKEIMQEKPINRKELNEKINDLENKYPHFNTKTDDKKGGGAGPGNSSDIPGARGGKGRERIAPGNDGDR